MSNFARYIVVPKFSEADLLALLARQKVTALLIGSKCPEFPLVVGSDAKTFARILGATKRALFFVSLGGDHGMELEIWESGSRRGQLKLDWEDASRFEFQIDPYACFATILSSESYEGLVAKFRLSQENAPKYEETELDEYLVDEQDLYAFVCKSFGFDPVDHFWIEDASPLALEKLWRDDYSDQRFVRSGHVVEWEMEADSNDVEIAAYRAKQAELYAQRVALEKERLVEGEPDVVITRPALPKVWTFGGGGEIEVFFGNRGGAFDDLHVRCESDLLKAPSARTSLVLESVLGETLAEVDGQGGDIQVSFEFPAARNLANPTVATEFRLLICFAGLAKGQGLFSIRLRSAKSKGRGALIARAMSIV